MTQTAVLIAGVVATAVICLLMPRLIRSLEATGQTVPDVNKKNVMVPRPAGPLLTAGLVMGLVVLNFFMQSWLITTVSLVSVISFLIGYIDDKKIMAGWFKPAALVACAVPVLLFAGYNDWLDFPFIGYIHIPLIGLVIVVLMFPVMGNTINSIDVLNGVVSKAVSFASFSLGLILLLQHNEMAAPAILLGVVSLSFYYFHRTPSRIFAGDSGTVMFGATYGAIAVLGDVEVLAAIAVMPAIFNSFLYLASVRKIIEHRKLKVKPIRHTEDMKLVATTEKNAPITLVRLLASSPLTERQLGRRLFAIFAVFGALAVLLSFF